MDLTSLSLKVEGLQAQEDQGVLWPWKEVLPMPGPHTCLSGDHGSTAGELSTGERVLLDFSWGTTQEGFLEEGGSQISTRRVSKV